MEFLSLIIIYEEISMTNLEIIAFEIKQQFALCQNISEYNNLDNYPIKKLFYLHIKINILENKLNNFYK